MATKRHRVFTKYGGRCAYCGCTISIDTFNQDHIFSKSDFKYRSHIIPLGLLLNDLENLNPSCYSCNSYKSSFSLEEFRSNIESQYKKLLRYPTVRLAQRYGIADLKPKKIQFYFEKTSNN